ncbi:hypothetical protein B0H13DRAFT_2312255 [Mycena leptocephala]|nr:hypothetical protein B0H13DRAFT_2312255 [Mycena leptocephala]
MSASASAYTSVSTSAISAFVRTVVVDDTDLAIRYGSEGWFVADPSVLTKGNWGPIYNGTSHATASADSTLSFPFTGTSITVRGSVIVSTDTNNVTDPTWTCSIDGIEIPSSTFQYAENNWPLCRQNQMASGAHTLTIQVKSKGQPFYIDGLSYTPPPEAVFPSAVLVYSDSDPALSYSAGWTEADGMSTQTAGSYVTLSFHGTSTTLFANIPGQGPPNATIAHYTIDGGAPYNNHIFTTPRLPDGLHNLTITHGGDINHTPLTKAPATCYGGGKHGQPVSNVRHRASFCTVIRRLGEAGYFARTRKRGLGATGALPVKRSRVPGG